MSWATFLLGVVKFIATLITWAQQKELIDAGAQQEIAAALKVQADQIERARVARAAAADRVRNGTASDPFRRD